MRHVRTLGVGVKKISVRRLQAQTFLPVASPTFIGVCYISTVGARCSMPSVVSQVLQRDLTATGLLPCYPPDGLMKFMDYLIGAGREMKRCGAPAARGMT